MTQLSSSNMHLGGGVYADLPYDHIARKNVPKAHVTKDVGHSFSWKIYHGQNAAEVKAMFFKKGEGKNGQTVNAIFDSGAQSVCLKKSICEKLGLTSIGEAKVSGATGSDTSQIYKCSVRLLHAVLNDDDNAMRSDVDFRDVLIWGINLPGQTDALLGWPIIRTGYFIIEDGKEVSLRY